MTKLSEAFCALSFALALLSGPPALAASASGRRAPAAVPAPPPPAASQETNAGPAPYEPDLLRLSGIVGSLAYLRDLCGAGDGAVWRAKMNALLQAASDSPLEKERLAGAYNKGFRDYELIYRTCTANARTVIARYLNEGAQLTRDVATRYGGD